MSWLLDADVLSQPAKRHGDPRTTAWLETEQDNCYTSAVVLAQLAYCVRSKEGLLTRAVASTFFVQTHQTASTTEAKKSQLECFCGILHGSR
jgi:predicted nucleic acid-binding protein